MTFTSSSDSVIRSLAAEPCDLTYAAALTGAAERLGEVTGLAQLWPLLAKEALTLIPADGTVIIEYEKRSWLPLAVQTGDGALTSAYQVTAEVDAAASQGLLTASETTDDHGQEMLSSGWRSVLVVRLDRRPSRVPTRLLWFADRSGGFAGYAGLADLLARHASLAARAVSGQESLADAMAARQRIGQAVGVLMARRQLTADEAFALLVRHSQDTNTKLRIIAEDVLLTGILIDGVAAAPEGHSLSSRIVRQRRGLRVGAAPLRADAAPTGELRTPRG